MNFPRDLPSSAEMASRMARIEALLEAVLERLPAAPEPVEPVLELEPRPVPPLVQALGDVFGPACFTARQAWQRASDDAARAQACGEPEPMLSAVLRDLRVYCPRGLGYHLRCYEAEGAGIGRGGQVHHVNSWEVLAWARQG